MLTTQSYGKCHHSYGKLPQLRKNFTIQVPAGRYLKDITLCRYTPQPWHQLRQTRARTCPLWPTLTRFGQDTTCSGKELRFGVLLLFGAHSQLLLFNSIENGSFSKFKKITIKSTLIIHNKSNIKSNVEYIVLINILLCMNVPSLFIFSFFNCTY